MADNTLYDKLETTARAHITSCLPQTLGSNDANAEAILSHLAPDFRMDWGHSFFVSTKPGLQGEVTGEGFVSHLTGMAPLLETWSIEIMNVSVDVEKRNVVVRADYHMVPKGGEEVLNDIIFWMVTDEGGTKLRKCTEFVDPVASAELAKRMKGGPVE